MARGGARPGAGRPRKALQDHALAGTFRRDRHGSRLAPSTTPAVAGDLRELVMAGLREAGRSFAGSVLDGYDLTPAEGHIVRVAGLALDDAAALRRCERTPETIRLEQASIRQFLAATRQLGLAVSGQGEGHAHAKKVS
jgi:hypothetical protein